MKVPTQDSRTADTPPWLQIRGDRLVLLLHVQPGARRTAVVGEHGDRLKIALHAPPIDGKANAELLHFLCGRLALRPRQAQLLSGQASRDKAVVLDVAVAPGTLARRLLDSGNDTKAPLK